MAEIAAAMKTILKVGLHAARHLRGDLYELRIDCKARSFRVLFSLEGRYSHILLSLVVFAKKTQKTPKSELELAERRLYDWRQRGRVKKTLVH